MQVQAQFQKALKAALPNMDSPTTGQPIIIEALAPMHGPCVRYSVVELLRKYRQASRPHNPRLVVMSYCHCAPTNVDCTVHVHIGLVCVHGSAA